MRPKSTDKSRAQALKEQLHEAQSRSSERLDERASRDIAEALSNADIEDRLQSCVGTAANVLLQAASLRNCLLPSPPDVSARLRQLCSYLFGIARLNKAMALPVTDGPGTTVDCPVTAIDVSHWACFLDYSFGDAMRGRWLAGEMLRYHAGGSIRIPSAEHDGEFRALFGVLCEAIHAESWPTLPDALGPYKRLIECRGDQAAFDAALTDVLDLRMARACGYPQVDATKALRGMEREGYVMEAIAFALRPAELWVIQELTKRIDGIGLALCGTHPWLASPTFAPPRPLLPIWEDELTQAIDAQGRKRFGPRWL
ncbi:MAG: hypothetical protein NTZ11_18525 [Gammaproteobacteria bacterium]|nr:hypothetical protein [Gammaproteobacteria bacterium]